MKKVVFFVHEYDYFESTYFELKKEKNVIFAGSNYITNPILKLINKLHTSYKTNQSFRLPLQHLWYPIYLLNKEIGDDDDIVFVFTEMSKLGYEFPYVQYLKKKYKNAKLVFRCENAASYINCQYLPSYNNSECLKRIEENYDLIVSFDLDDCISHSKKWIYYPCLYAGKTITNSCAPKSDILFLGQDKGRLPFLVDIYDWCTDKGLKCLFFVANSNKKIEREGIYYIQHISYTKYLEYVVQTKCILEVLASKQSGSTLRTGEAIFYGKKLLTNCINIKNSDLYSNEYISQFTKKEDIDIDFICSKEQPCINKERKEKISPNAFINFLQGL